jgi:hypothetical protein
MEVLAAGYYSLSCLGQALLIHRHVIVLARNPLPSSGHSAQRQHCWLRSFRTWTSYHTYPTPSCPILCTHYPPYALYSTFFMSLITSRFLFGTLLRMSPWSSPHLRPHLRPHTSLYFILMLLSLAPFLNATHFLQLPGFRISHFAWYDIPVDRRACERVVYLPDDWDMGVSNKSTEINTNPSVLFPVTVNFYQDESSI